MSCRVFRRVPSAQLAKPAAPTMPAVPAEPAVPASGPAAGLPVGPLAADPSPAQLRRAMGLGVVGVLIFAMTLPMTRLAVGPAGAPQLSPEFVAAGRAALAGLLSLLYLAVVRAAPLARAHWPALAVSALGTVLGFPLCLGWALREVNATHAAVVTGVLPLATAVAAAIHWRQRPSVGFWACAVAGCLIVLGFAAVRGGGHLVTADAWLLLAVAAGAVGYVGGARVSASVPAEQVICWVLVASLPLTAPAMALTWPATPVRAEAWLGFAYVTIGSMWLGFFAWYRALALGGAVRVSQVQLVQPFAALMLAVPVLGERLDPLTVACALGVVATVFVGRRMPIGRPGP